LQDTAKLIHLWYSKEFQIFVRSSGDIEKVDECIISAIEECGTLKSRGYNKKIRLAISQIKREGSGYNDCWKDA